MAGFSREVARRVFAEELRSSNLSFREGEDQHQYAPQYLLTPSGARCNRIFLVGTLTEKDDIGGEVEYWRGRVVDPTGSVLIYAGQYQPSAAQALAGLEPPVFVAVVGKPSLYETEDGRKIMSIRAESVQKVDETTRHRWILETARLTLDRLKRIEEKGQQAGTLQSGDFQQGDAYQPGREEETDYGRARLHYGTDVLQYREMVAGALKSVIPEIQQSGTEKTPAPRALEREGGTQTIEKPALKEEWPFEPQTAKDSSSGAKSARKRARSPEPAGDDIADDVEQVDLSKIR